MTQGERSFHLTVLPAEMLSAFSNRGLLELKELYKSPCLSSHLTDVENETRIAKKKAVFFKPLLETRRCTFKKPLSGVEE